MTKLIPEQLKKFYRVLKSIIGSAYYGFPSKDLKIIGVTGTSGKSTTSSLIFQTLRANGYKAGIVSTVGAIAGNKIMDTGLHVTTPEPIQMHQILKFMKDRGVEYVVLEASSHALAQGRLGLIKFDHAVFTNIKRDHLDWHKTWEGYARAKAILIDKTKPGGKIVINRDDKKSYQFLTNFIKDKNREDDRITYSMNDVTEITETVLGTNFKFGTNEFQLPILGRYNVENALATIDICKEIGLSDEQIVNGLKSFIGLKGRMQIMQPTPFAVIVDFAHNTDSLQKSLETAVSLTGNKGRVISIFGSAGLRDIEKRKKMGEVSGKHADITIVTSEDPRTDSLYEINTEIIDGAIDSGARLISRFGDKSAMEKYLDSLKDIHFDINNKSIYAFDQETVDSRFDAIEFAVRIAKPGDVVITNGKGHEESLCFGKTEYPFTDQEAVEKALGQI